MKAILFSFLLVSVAWNNCTAQDLAVDIKYSTAINPSDKSQIYYTASQPLAIEDFKGSPVNGGEAVAITSSGFSFKAGFRNADGKATLDILVYCSFDKNKSWMNAQGKNPYILKHEQQHFNISYIGTLLFMKKMKAAKFTIANFSKQTEKIYNDAAKEMEQLQNKYDLETSNGRIPDKQAAWEEKIAAELERLGNS